MTPQAEPVDGTPVISAAHQNIDTLARYLFVKAKPRRMRDPSHVYRARDRNPGDFRV
ncbi:MAG: hypothetical protein H6R26_97 [Proteobacteria bacterium]|nr:hypothetical protein [Pseudomonadota bacterium]